MKNLVTFKRIALHTAMLSLVFTFQTAWAQPANSNGKIAQKINILKQKGSFTKESFLFSVAANDGKSKEVLKSVKRFTLLDIKNISEILTSKPAFLNFSIPVNNGQKSIRVLLYKESISPNGFTLISNDGNVNDAGNIVHYKGAIDADGKSIAAFSFSENEISGIVNNNEGNYVIGGLQDHSGRYIIYNDKDLVKLAPFDCNTNTDIPVGPGNYYRASASAATLTTKCVNWYWETDVDIFTAKGSLANVNAFMQGIFNQVQTLYANDGISITLKTLFVWTTTDPYTGTSTSGYLDQFGIYRTTFDGDLATLIGTKGGGGIAWINGLCNSQNKYKMSYCGITTSYATIPTYSWTVEVITHEQGHLLGSRHTHDCVWNGNNTKIDGCGDNAGYPSGSCAVPANPTGGGTIMSYCHLTGTGINFNLGFGPQPTALIINNVNNAACLINCSTGCTTPNQPALITGNTAVCATTAQTYSVAAVVGATSYNWVLPQGWSGTSTTNSINVTTGTASGNISVTAVNTCGSGAAKTVTINTNAAPAQPSTITGNTAVCSGTAQTYVVNVVAGSISYTWTIPSGWSGSSTTNSINITSGSSAGSIVVKANNGCGSGATRSLAVNITASTPAQPGAITGVAIACPGNSQTYSVTAVAGAGSYAWTLPSGWSGTSTTNTITATAGTTGGTISVTAANGCGTSTATTLTVTAGGSVPSAPSAITATGGIPTICTGESRTYTVLQAAGVSYNWATATGVTINSGQGTNSINVSFTAAFSSPGILSVTASNSCGPGPASSISISKNVIARPGTITISGGIARVCSGDTRAYSVAAVAGITYAWIAPSGANINSGQGTSTISITYTNNFTANGTLNVTANNQCGTSTATTINIIRNTPTSPAPIAGPATICNGTIGTYSVAPVTAATGYIWGIPAGATVQGPSNSNTISILWGTTGGNLSVRATNSCGNSGSRSLKIIISCNRSLAETAPVTYFRMEAYPNPTSDIVHLRFYSKENTSYSFTVTDVAGRKLLFEKQQAYVGMNVHTLNLSRFRKGTYLVLVEDKDVKQVLKINVQ